MDNPCRSDCPAGDCAGCVFPWPTARSRCTPTRCPQASTCARAGMAPAIDVLEIDASRQLAGQPCWLFIDARGMALLEPLA
jgi:hypothetical protein